MIKKVLLMLSVMALLSFSACKNVEKEGDKMQTRDVYIIAGQSNALGVSPVKGLGDLAKKEFKNINFYTNSNNFYKWNNTMLTVKPGYGFTSESFGLEFGVANYIQNKYSNSNQALIIKYSSDGTSLYDRWKPKEGLDFIGLINTCEEAQKILLSQKVTPNFKGVIWMQGESDSLKINEAEAYEDNLTTFIEETRKSLNQNSLKFAIGQTNPNNKTLIYRNIVNTAQKNVSQKLENVYFVDTSDLNVLIDNYHYNAYCEVELGERLVSYLL